MMRREHLELSTTPTHLPSPREQRALSLLYRLAEELGVRADVPYNSSELVNFVFGDVELDERLRRVTRAGVPVALTPREFELLLALAKTDGAVSKNYLMDEIWRNSIAPSSRTIDQHVSELRRKLEPNPSHPQYIITVQRYGYRLEGRWVGRKAS